MLAFEVLEWGANTAMRDIVNNTPHSASAYCNWVGIDYPFHSFSLQDILRHLLRLSTTTTQQLTMEQQRAINALESFLALSKSANSPRAAADLVTQATSHPQTYVFAELLHTPNIQALRTSPDYAGHHKLLEVFAWGTWADYQCMYSTSKYWTPKLMT